MVEICVQAPRFLKKIEFDFSFKTYLQEFGGVLRPLEDALTEVQRLDIKVQSTLDIKKQNLKNEEKKHKELVKNMEEVRIIE